MIKHRSFIFINCKECKKRLKIRKDYIKVHTGYCQSCRKKEDWKNTNYRAKCEQLRGKMFSKLPDGEANFNNLFYSYCKSAQIRGIIFLLTKEEFRYLTKQNCFYCGKLPTQIHGENSKQFTHGYWVYNGIDRVDDCKGYSLDNVVTACKVCNYAKQGLSLNEFLNLIKIIYYYKNLDTMGSRQVIVK